MTKQVCRIDGSGYFIEDVNLGEGEETPTDCIEIRPDTSIKEFYRPRWNGTEWVEDMSQEEIEELNKQPEKETSFEELQLEYNIDLDYRLSIIEMGLI